ncbi:MAG: TerB family tellurite resistance protein [Bacteroidaceae bacterium]|nr:TerB family tellurite resistance protein [Bacteroidaceae bacterium]
MAFGKWIGGWLGWILSQNILGAIAGYVLGSIVDAFTEQSKNRRLEQEREEAREHTRQYYQQRDYYQQRQKERQEQQQQQQREGNRNSFLFSLMVLSAHIIQADGRIMHSEMEYMRNYLRQSFGDAAAIEGDSILKKLFEYRKQQGQYIWQAQIRQACQEMAEQMEEEHRLQLMAFLCEIAKADGHIDNTEIAALRQVAIQLMLDEGVVDQLLHLGGTTIDDDYAVLGITKNATDEEVKRAYKKMALKYHPDRVATLGEDVKAAAQRKFQEINNAKERIYKSRNIK